MEDWWRHKLFQPKSIEGEPVKEQLDYIRELFEFARKDSRLKGITIIGSTLKGYTSSRKKKVSDIDIAIVCDDSPGQGVYVSLYGNKIELNNRRKKTGLPIFEAQEIAYCNINALTPERIKKIDDYYTLQNATSLVFPGVGDLETYRKIVREEINTYSEAEKEK